MTTETSPLQFLKGTAQRGIAGDRNQSLHGRIALPAVDLAEAVVPAESGQGTCTQDRLQRIFGLWGADALPARPSRGTLRGCAAGTTFGSRRIPNL